MPALLSNARAGPLTAAISPAPVPHLRHTSSIHPLLCPCVAAAAAAAQPSVSDYLSATAQKIGQEIQLEATLRVTAVQAVNCEEQYHHRLSNSELLKDAPLLANIPAPGKQQFSSAGGDEQLLVQVQVANNKALAACLATPEEVDKGELRNRVLQSRPLASSTQDVVTQNVERFSAWMSRVRRARRRHHLSSFRELLARRDPAHQTASASPPLGQRQPGLG
ncbi:MAG: hypothetical protein WDW38_000714 [Sanguina aurantia]